MKNRQFVHARSMWLESHRIALVEAGAATIYHHLSVISVKKGDIYYLPPGDYVFENTSPFGMEYREVKFEADSDSIGDALIHLYTINDKFQINHCLDARSLCELHKTKAWPEIEIFFASPYFDESLGFTIGELLKFIKLMELAVLLQIHPSGHAVLHKLLCCTNKAETRFTLLMEDMIMKKDCSIRTMTEAAGMSLTAFKNYFHKVFNTTPHRWVSKNRLNRARILLETSDLSVSVIAATCLFDNVSHFIKLFKQEFGDTPLNYKRRLKDSHTSC